jgi:hypothetical protein
MRYCFLDLQRASSWRERESVTVFYPDESLKLPIFERFRNLNPRGAPRDCLSMASKAFNGLKAPASEQMTHNIDLPSAMIISAIRDHSSADIIVYSGDGKDCFAHAGNLCAHAPAFADSISPDKNIIFVSENGVVLDTFISLIYPESLPSLSVIEGDVILPLYNMATKYKAFGIRGLLRPRLQYVELLPHVHTVD